VGMVGMDALVRSALLYDQLVAWQAWAVLNWLGLWRGAFRYLDTRGLAFGHPGSQSVNARNS